MLRSFRDRYLPVFQAPDAPGGGSAPSAPSGPSTSGATPSSTPSPSSASPSTPSSPDASSTPPSTPTGGTPSTPEPSGGADFEFMFSQDGGDPFDPSDGLSPPVTEPKEPKPAQPAAAQPATPPAKPAEPEAPKPAATPAPTEPTSPATTLPSTPNLDPFDPGALAQHLETNQEQVVQFVADNLFKLSDKDVEALESDVVGTIPKLLARSFVAAQQNLLMQMSRIIPRMIERQGEVTKRHTEAVNEFYTRWPDIGKAKDQRVAIGDKQVAVADLVKQYAVVYRQMHPEASRQDAIEAVGPMVMMAAKIVPGVPAQAPAVPSSPMAPTGASGRPPQPSPFTPAGPASGGAAPTTVPQLTPVEAMFANDE